jgi:hypothetical protein
MNKFTSARSRARVNRCIGITFIRGSRWLVALLLTMGIAAQAQANACAYAPSNLLKTGGVVAGTTALAGASLKAAGLYTLTHSITGATMLGSTAAGSSAAGTVGIIGGTWGLLGSAAAVLMSPVVVTVGAVGAGGALVYEGACYFLGKGNHKK